MPSGIYNHNKIKKDITGHKFNRLTAVKFIYKVDRLYYWLFKCDCGKEIILRRSSVTRNETTNCGCQATNFKHGMIKSRFYKIWGCMKNRCLQKNSNSYKDYGGRGIKMCDRWLEKFENFRDDMYKSYLEHVKQFGELNTQIERINNDGNYCLENCKWSTIEEQANNRRSNKFITYGGKTLSRVKWSKMLGITQSALYSRIDKMKWPIQRALTEKSNRK